MADAEPTFWGIHAGRLGEADTLFKKGYIALGWDAMGDLSRIPPTRDAYKQEVAVAYPNDKPASIPGSAGQLFRFVHEMKNGDFVIRRSKIDHLIHIGKVTGSYQYNPTLDPDFPQLRPVQWLKTIPPVQVSQGALYEIGSALTLFQVKNYADEWKTLLAGKQPPIEETKDLEAGSGPNSGPDAGEIEQLTRDFILKRLAQDLKGHPFASFVAHLLGTMGYRTRVSPEGPDGGIDVIAHKDELGFEPPIVKVQFKSTLGNVGHPDVSALVGTLSTTEFGLVVTLGGFTTAAKNFAKNKSNIRLIDGDDLVDLVLDHYEHFDPRYKGLIPLKRVYVPEPLAATDD